MWYVFSYVWVLAVKEGYNSYNHRCCLERKELERRKGTLKVGEITYIVMERWGFGMG